jgi:fusaric acid resistance family protein
VALAVGVLPAAVAELAPTRRARLRLPVLGVLTGLPLFAGGVLSGSPPLAVAAVGTLGVAAAALARRSRMGVLAMTLSLPLFGVGLSYSELGESAATATLIVAGSAFACAVSMLWPQRARATGTPRAPGAPPTAAYGVRLGAAGATAAAIGFLLDLEHVGWACAAALLVMRPSAEMQRLRSAGRILAVTAGALAGVALTRLGPPDAWYSLAALAAVAGAAATSGSRWYVTSAFTTFLVFLLLLHTEPEAAGARFAERLGETLLGVGIAYAYGLLLPALAHVRRPTERLA